MRGLGLFLQSLGVVAGVEIGRDLLQLAGDFQPLGDGPVVADGLPVGPGVLSGPLRAEILGELLVGQAVLEGDFGGCVLGLAAAHPVGLQHHHPDAPLLEKPGGEYPGHPRADDGHVGFQIVVQCLAGRQGNRLSPNRFHSIKHLALGLTEGGEIIPFRGSLRKKDRPSAKAEGR